MAAHGLSEAEAAKVQRFSPGAQWTGSDSAGLRSSSCHATLGVGPPSDGDTIYYVCWQRFH
eukprot:2232438-Rhodomonas_salina.1